MGLLQRVASEDKNSGALRDDLVGVDGLVRRLSVEDLVHELDGTRNAGRSTDEDVLVYVRLVGLRVMEDLLDRVEHSSGRVFDGAPRSGHE